MSPWNPEAMDLSWLDRLPGPAHGPPAKAKPPAAPAPVAPAGLHFVELKFHTNAARIVGAPVEDGRYLLWHALTGPVTPKKAYTLTPSNGPAAAFLPPSVARHFLEHGPVGTPVEALDDPGSLDERVAAYRAEVARLPRVPRLPPALDLSLFALLAAFELARSFGIVDPTPYLNGRSYSPEELGALWARVRDEGHTDAARGRAIASARAERLERAAQAKAEAERAAAEAARLHTRRTLCIVREHYVQVDPGSWLATELYVGGFHDGFPPIVPVNTSGLPWPDAPLALEPGVTVEVRDLALTSGEWSRTTRNTCREVAEAIRRSRRVEGRDISAEERPGLDTVAGLHAYATAKRAVEEIYRAPPSVRGHYLSDLCRATRCREDLLIGLLKAKGFPPSEAIGANAEGEVLAALKGGAVWREDELWVEPTELERKRYEKILNPAGVENVLRRLTGQATVVTSEQIVQALQEEGEIEGNPSPSLAARIGELLTAFGFRRNQRVLEGKRRRLWEKVEPATETPSP